MQNSLIVAAIALFAIVALGLALLATLRRFIIFPAALRFVPDWPSDLRAETRAFIERKIAELSTHGFITAIIGHHVASGPHPQSPQVRMHNPTTGDLATLGVVADPKRGSMNITITSEFFETRSLSTSTEPTFPFSEDPRVVQLSFPWVRDAATLLEAHRRALRVAGLESAPRTPYTDERGLQYMNHGWQDFLGKQTAGGLMWFDAAPGVYRPTWKGIFRTAFGTFGPTGRRSMRSAEAKHRKVWQELGMDEWEKEHPSVAPPFEESEALRAAPREELVLGEGEIRVEKSGAETIVRIGASGRAPGAARGCLGVVIFTILGGILLLATVMVLRINSNFPSGPRELVAVAFITFGVLMIAMAIWPDFRRVLAQGPIPPATVVIRASPAGLSCQNPVGFPPFASIARHDILEIVVSEDADPMKRQHALLVDRRPPNQPKLLCTCPAVAALQTARQELSAALGPQLGLLKNLPT